VGEGICCNENAGITYRLGHFPRFKNEPKTFMPFEVRQMA
jgi:hypothetical protein